MVTGKRDVYILTFYVNSTKVLYVKEQHGKHIVGFGKKRDAVCVPLNV